MKRIQSTVAWEARGNRDADRGVMERLLARAEHLPLEDRLLLEQVYRHGLPVTHVARLCGLRADVVRRRVAGVVRRLRHPLFQFMVLHGDLLDPPVRRTAEMMVFQGKSLRGASAEAGLKLHRVRAHWQILRTLARV